jgi:outer membrane protein assembly factor BamB
LPVEFGPGKNERWHLEIPAGSSSPVIISNKVCLTGFSGNQRSVLCLDLATGRLLWERSLEAERSERKTEPNDAASSTPVTDGNLVYALFSGIGLICYTADGEERWRRALGPFTQPHGMSSSPILVGGSVIVLADQVADSNLSAFDAKTGGLKWKVPRPNFVGGYSTPIVFHDDLVVAGPAELVGYAASDGKRLWSAPKMGVMPISSPICDGDRIFVNNGAVPPFEALAKDLKADRNGDGKLTPDEFPDPSFKEAVLAIDRVYGNGDGAVDKQEWDGALRLMQVLNALAVVQVDHGQPKEVWRTTKSLPEVATPLIYQGVLYLLRDGGLLAAVNPANGQVQKQERLAGAGDRYFASPIAADNKLFTVSESGVVSVIQPGYDWRPLGRNDLGDQCFATPAIADNTVVIRSKKTLWAFRQAAAP